VADLVFNVAKGKAAEKVADGSTAIGILLLKVAESDAAMRDRTTIADLLAGNTEANFDGYARKTGLAGTVTIDQALDQVTIGIADQTWATAGGITNNSLVKLVLFYEEAAADASRIPLVALDFVTTTDGTNLTAQFTNPYFYKAA
jgi:hypothetical protein